MHRDLIGNDENYIRLLNYSKEVLLSINISDTTINYISHSVEHVLNFTIEKFINKRLNLFTDLIHPEDKEGAISSIMSFAMLNNNDFPLTIKYRIKDADGEYHFFCQDHILVTAKNGNNELICCAYDLTKQKEAKTSCQQKNIILQDADELLHSKNDELSALNAKTKKRNLEIESTYAKLAESEEIFRQVAENTNDALLLRSGSKILYINSQFERIWGRPKEEVIKNPDVIIDWVHPDDRSDAEPWIKIDSLAKNTPYIQQYRIIKPNGEIRWLASKLFQVYNDKGSAYRILSVSTDITEQKDFEEALRKAKVKAQESDLLKSTFLANISHEIRTPMNGIVGFAELIVRDGLTKDKRSNYIEIMKKSSEQLIHIIDDIIDFAKIESNQIRITPRKINLNQLLNEVLVFYEKQDKRKNSVTLSLNNGLDDSSCTIVSDDYRIRQVLLNLIDNALKYTDKGSVEFGYKLINQVIEFYVQDTGIGIEKEKKELIFERFRQGDEGNTRKFGGTGIGLSISKGLVNLLGGRIWVESEPKLGSTFCFTIPYNIEETVKVEDKKEIIDQVESFWPDKVILIAEDDDLNFEYFSILFEDTQAKILRAHDGSQAVKICSSVHVDVILMDIRLPVMNGMQATKLIREMGYSIPIIAQTAFALDEDIKLCMQAGCDRYLTKPISHEKIFKLLNEFLMK